MVPYISNTTCYILCIIYIYIEYHLLDIESIYELNIQSSIKYTYHMFYVLVYNILFCDLIQKYNIQF